MRNTIAILTCFLLVNGCSINTFHEPVQHEAYDSPLKELNLVALASEKNLRRLSHHNSISSQASWSDAQKKQSKHQASTVPEGFEVTASFDFVGEADIAAQSLAKLAGYQFRAVGRKPEIPILVNLHADQKPLHDVVHDFAAQLGAKARYSIFPAAKVVELRYLS